MPHPLLIYPLCVATEILPCFVPLSLSRRGSVSLTGFSCRPSQILSMATAPSSITSGVLSISSQPHPKKLPSPPYCSIFTGKCFSTSSLYVSCSNLKAASKVVCKATDISVAEESPASGDSGGDDGKNWVPVVPLSALPRGERRVIIQDGETILLLWYKDEIFAIENRSPAEGAYTEGLLNAKLTKDGCIVCPTTDSAFDLRTGVVKEWYPNNPVLRALTPSLRTLFVYPVKTDVENIYISMGGGASSASAEIVFSGKAQPGVTASDVNVEEVRMVVDEELQGFGFNRTNELINGKAATIGFLLLLDFELLTGKGLLKGTGFLDFIYAVSNAFS